MILNDSEYDPGRKASVTDEKVEEGPVIMRKGKTFFKTTIELNKENVELFRVFFPAHGALKEFLNNALAKFVAIHEPTADRDLTEAVEATVNDMRSSEANPEEESANG